MVPFLKFGVVGILGVLVLILGLIAEHKRVKNDDGFTTTSNGKYCRYAKTGDAERLGLAAAFLLLAAQIIASVSSRCVCCCEGNRETRSTSRKICAILCLVISWILAVISFNLLVVYGIVNSSYKHNTTNGGCPAPPPYGLASGAVLGFIAEMLGVMVIALAQSKRQQGLPQHGAAVQMPQYASGAPSYYPSASNNYPVNK